MMTRKDYNTIAKVINKNYTLENRETIQAITNELGGIYRDENPRFDMQKWVNGCMLKVFHVEPQQK